MTLRQFIARLLHPRPEEDVSPLLRWTAQLPIIDGWYWICGDNLSPRITRVHLGPGDNVLHDYSSNIGNVYGTFKYAGPIPWPKAASHERKLYHKPAR